MNSSMVSTALAQITISKLERKGLLDDVDSDVKDKIRQSLKQDFTRLIERWQSFSK